MARGDATLRRRKRARRAGPRLLNVYTGARSGELAGQTKREYDELNQAIGIFEPLKEVNGRLIEGGRDVTDSRARSVERPTGRGYRRWKRGTRTKSPAGTRWVRLSPSMALLYELLVDTIDAPESFVFVSGSGTPWYRSNFRQRHWRSAWDGTKPDDPEALDHTPPVLADVTFHEGRHTHSTWLVQDGIPEVARRARLGHKMPGIARVYEHVTPEMEAQIAAALEARWIASLGELTDAERGKLFGWLPALAHCIDGPKDRPSGAVGGATVSHISPTG